MPGVGTVDRGGVAPATKTFPSTDYKGSGWPEIVVEIRAVHRRVIPYSKSGVRLLPIYFSQGAGAARGLLYVILGPSHAAKYIRGPLPGHD